MTGALMAPVSSMLARRPRARYGEFVIGGLDFNGMQLAPALPQQIDRGPAGRAPKVRHAVRVRNGLASQQVFQHKGFPARAPDRVTAQDVQRVVVKQRPKSRAPPAPTM